MIKAYRRRAFLLVAIAALEPAAASAARADNDSLWDLLARTERPPVTARQPGDGPAGAEMVAARQSLGPVPGFSLPSHRTQADPAHKKKRRAGMFGAVGNFFDHLQSVTGSKVKVSGHETLSLQWSQVSGGEQATQSYQDQQYYGRGSNGIYNDAALSIDATLFKYIHYQTQFSNSLFSNPNDNQFKIDYNPNRKLRLEYGDINAGLSGNSLIDFNRYLYGISFKNQWTPHLSTSMLYTQTKAETRTITIPGNDSAGPYYAFAGQIVPGSDRVRVDNKDMVRGQDYTLDPYSGALNFLNGRIILHTSTIAISYEVLGVNTGSSIYGLRTDYSVHPGFSVGLTYVTQQSPNNGGLQTQTQDFQGYDTAGATYLLNYPADATKPIYVYVNGAPLAKGEYLFSPQQPDQIIIVQAVPRYQIVEVKYFPANTTPIVGNQSVMGLDSRITMGKLGSLTLESAFSGMMLSGSRYSGSAFQARADLHPSRNLNATLTVRDISPTYSSIQNPGFDVNERSVNLTSDYSPTKRLKLNLNWEMAKRPSYSGGVYGVTSTTTPSTIGNDTYNTYTLGAIYNLAKNATLNLSHNSMSTQYALGGNSSNVDDTLAFDYTLNKLTFDTSLSHNGNTASSIYNGSALAGGSATTTTQLYNINTDTFSKRLGMTWNPKSWFSLSGAFSDNTISDNSGTSVSHSDARDTQITASFRRIRNLSINYSYDLSDTGNLSTLLGNTSTTGGSGTATGTGSASGSGSGSGSVVGSPRAFLFLPRAYLAYVSPFALMPLSRQAVGTGAAGTGASGQGNSLGTYIGSGGSNATLGGYGSYSGLLGGGSYNSLYGASSFGGRNATQRLSIDYHPRQNLQIGLHMNIANSIGDYQYNSNRSDNGLDLFWQPSKRLQLNASVDLQDVQYVGGLGGTKTSAILFAMQGRPFGGKLTTTLSWTAMRTTGSLNLAAANSTIGTTNGATGTTGATNADTNLTSLSLRLEYPVGRRESLFVDMLRSDSSGALASTQQNLQFGLDYALLGNLQFSLGWQFLSNLNKDPNYAAENYRVSSLLAQLGMHF